ncbi:hypothetical protein C7N43_04165 [Sphingobacteriales bacterium UPWRP_1]|nr:hypothetical protein B6N25_04710 [Sphingobacteriales bacterium TSM_CSS]PSJ78262.1 hypothetical protein C7N43_04165 [Sphingobacteriales bacterium UPWRP_1]
MKINKKHLFFLTLMAALAVQCLLAQNNGGKLTQSDTTLTFTDFIQGTKYAEVLLTPETQKQIDNEGSILLNHFAGYLKNMGFKTVALTTAEKNALHDTVPSLCDIARVKIQMEVVKKQFFVNHLMEFTTCLDAYYRYTSPDTLFNDPFLLDKLYTVWKGFTDTTFTYNSQKRLKLPVHATAWNEDTLKKYLSVRYEDKLEGIYEKVIVGAPNKTKYRIAIVRNQTSGNYDAIYLSGATNYNDWKAGELIGQIFSTGTLNFFNVNWYKPNKQPDAEVYLSVDQSNMLYFNFANEDETVYKYYKQYPRQDPQRRILATGSGIAISPDGYIVTNNHVIEGGNLIEVQGTRGGQRMVYRAVVMINDEINDLAILKIDDWSFKTLPPIPYTIKTIVSEVGEKVYTLGYPLAATMGESLKLTDGVISAQKGFKGDVSTYQVTVPVHPGNSGGPLFDMKGNLISIIKAKHSQAESATYAIKTRNVLNLIELLPEKIVMPESSELAGKDLTQQVKMLEEFVFFIKVLE